MRGYNLQSILTLIRKPIPIYVFADLNARHAQLGHNNNTTRSIITNLIRRNIIVHLGPEFSTFVRGGGTGNPDIALGNRNVNLNITITQGPITTSDHMPMYIHLATRPIVIKGTKKYKIKQANWDIFQRYITRNLDQTPVENQTRNIIKTKDQIDGRLNKWFEVIESTMKE